MWFRNELSSLAEVSLYTARTIAYAYITLTRMQKPLISGAAEIQYYLELELNIYLDRMVIKWECTARVGFDYRERQDLSLLSRWRDQFRMLVRNLTHYVSEVGFRI